MAALLIAVPASGQDPTVPPAREAMADAYLDTTARHLVDIARGSWSRSQSTLLAYTAIVRQRISAALRTPLRDRTVFRAESAARVRWDRDDPIIAQVLAGRMQHPAGVEIDADVSVFAVDQLFDPSSDRLLFGLTDRDSEDIWIRHPLASYSEQDYRFRSGDTLTLRLPDGRQVRTVELDLLPRRASPDLLRGTLWIDPETGILARAAFELARTLDIVKDGHLIDPDLEEIEEDMDEVPLAMRPIIKGLIFPLELDIDLAVVEYSLWEFRHWLPSVLRLEGTVRAGIFSVPGVLEVAYEVLDVEDEESVLAAADSSAPAQTGPPAPDPITEEWLEAGEGYRLVQRRQNGRDVLVLVPNRIESLAESRFLPPPVWKDAPEFLAVDDIERLEDLVGDVPVAHRMPVQWDTRVGLERFGLVRYNRVEALSVGAQVEARRYPFTTQLTGRIGVADLVPNAELRLQYSGTRRAVRLEGYHHLTTVTRDDRALGPGNSFTALFFGRDDGEYYRATGARLTLLPPPEDRADAALSVYAERQRAAPRETNVSLPAAWTDGWTFRPNIAADPADQVGSVLSVQRWWGDDLGGARLGADLYLHAATGDYEFVRGSLGLRGVVSPVERFRVGLEAAGGTSAGRLSVQRLWYLGGIESLRGYGSGAATGGAYLRARLELLRSFVESAAAVSLFGDAGWAGDPNGFTAQNAVDGALYSVGAGLTVMDGLLRMDLARGLAAPRGWRFELYLDAAF